MRWLAAPEPVVPGSRAPAAVVSSALTTGFYLAGQWILPAIFLIGAVISGARAVRGSRDVRSQRLEPTWGDSGMTSRVPKEAHRDLYEDWKDATESQPDQAPIPTDRWSMDLLKRLEWKRFEILCSVYFEALGFRFQRTHAGADGGVDIRLYSDGASDPGIFVQCKAWRDRQVGVATVRELFGVMNAEGVGEGIVISTSMFSLDALAFAKGKNIHLISGEEFLGKLLDLDLARQDSIRKLVTDGDFTTPTCPSCGDGVQMKLRVSRKDGSRFWGCSRYPACRTTMRVGNQEVLSG